MLAQWKSDGLITRKCLDRNEDMYFFLCTYLIVIVRWAHFATPLIPRYDHRVVWQQMAYE
jgi:hypothetical protein